MTPNAILSWVVRRMLGETDLTAPAPEDWTAALAALSANRLTTTAAWLLRDRLSQLPDEVQSTFRLASARALFANERAGAQLGELARAIGEDDFEWVILRGLPLAARLYPDSICRPSRDIDLLVAPESLERAGIVLQKLGYHPLRGRKESHHHRYQRPGAPDWDDIIELHWRPGPPSRSGVPTGDILSTRRAVVTAWGTLWVPGPEAELDLLITHYVRHAGWQLILLLDILLVLGPGATVSHRDGALLEGDLRRLGIGSRITGPRSWRQLPLRRWLSRHKFSERREARRAAPLEVALAQGHTWEVWRRTMAGLLWPEQPSPRWQAFSTTPWGRRSWRWRRLLTMGHGAPSSPIGFLRLALWFGLVGGLGEVMVHAIRRFTRHRFLQIGDDTVWMAPIAVFLLLLAVGLMLRLVQRARHQPPNDLLIPAFLLFVATGILLAYPRLHWMASFALATGVALQGTRSIRRRFSGFHSLVRRTLIPLVGVVLLGTALLVLVRWRERRPVDVALPAGSPNVLLILLDTVRELDFDGGDGLSHYLPRLSRAARSGVRFYVAFAPSSWTLPSHASIFTGRWPSEHLANWDHPLDDRFRTLAEALRQLGYQTAAFVANKVYVTRETGLARGFEEFHDFIIGPGELLRSSMILRTLGENLRIRNIIGWYEPPGRKHAPDVTREALDWLSEHQARPFFVFLNYFDAHGPYLPPPPYDSALRALGDGKDPRLRFKTNFEGELPPPAVVEEGKTAYAGLLRYLDGQVAGLLDSLEQRGLMQNTWVILTSDHGEEFGEHGGMGHGHNLYRSTVQVPLVIWGPGLDPGSSTAPVSLRNIPATVMDWVRPGGFSGFPGTSLLRIRSTGDSARSELIWTAGMAVEDSAGGADLTSWVRDSMRVILRAGGKETLLPLSDPLEQSREVGD